MFVLTVGLTYRQTPIKIREKTAIASQELAAVNQKLNQEKSLLENVILSTCNRTEIFAVVDQLHTGRYYIKRFLAETFQLSMEQLEPYLEFREDQVALEHCFRLGCGLESMVLGETQILGQIKTSFAAAQAAQTTGTIFNYLFPELVRFAKQMHTEYKINDRSASLSQAALQVARDKLGTLADKKIMVLGAGEMAELVVKNTQNFTVGEVQVCNRSLQRAQGLAQWCKACFSSRPLNDFYQEVGTADIVISALGLESPWVKKADLAAALRQRQSLLLIDLGVPRNIDPHCQLLPNVTLCDVDAIYQLIEAHQQQRQQIVRDIEGEVAVAVANFFTWEKQLGIVPLIRELREQTLAAEEAAMASLLRKIPQLGEREVKVIRKHMKSIVNQTLRTPIKEIKELAVQENAAYDIAVVQRIFGLQEEGKVHEE